MSCLHIWLRLYDEKGTFLDQALGEFDGALSTQLLPGERFYINVQFSPEYKDIIDDFKITTLDFGVEK